MLLSPLSVAILAVSFIAPPFLVQEKGPEEGSAPPAAAEKRPVAPADYAKWESLRGGELSPDGRWLAYDVRRVDGDRELRLRMLATDSKEIFEHASGAEFSADSKWLAFRIGVSKKEREKAKKSKKPLRSDLGLHDLVTGETTEVEEVASFEFSDDGAYLIMSRHPIDGRKSRGVDIILRDMASGIDTNFGNVGSYAWNDDGTLLAMIIDAEDQAGNGVRVYDAKTGLLRTLDSADQKYTALTWRDDAADLAVLMVKSLDEEDVEEKGKKGKGEKKEEAKSEKKDEEPTRLVLSWRGLDSKKPKAKVYDPDEDESFPEGMRIVDNEGLQWADDGTALFFGLKEREEDEDEEEEAKEPEKETPEGDTVKQEKKDEKEKPAPEEGAEKKPEKAAKEKGKEKKKGEEKEEKGAEEETKSLRETLKDPAGVDVWHAKDIEIIPRQKKTAGRDERRSHLAALWLDERGLVQLGSELTEDVLLLDGQKHAVGSDNTPYEEEKRYGPTVDDLYLIHAATGERSKIAERIKYQLGSGPGGKFFLYLKDGHCWSYEVASGEHRNLTGAVETSFVDLEDSSLTDEKRPFGVCGWLKDGGSVLLYDEFDIWYFRADGSTRVRLTRGAEKQVRHRRVILDYEKEKDGIDPGQDVYLSLYGDRTKKSGYARLVEAELPEVLIWEDASIRGLAKAEDAEIYCWLEMAFDDSPDIFVGGPDLGKPRQATATNPFQDDYLWGHTELIDYTSTTGVELQGALAYPAGYEEGKKYPMIVYIYEELSQTLHQYGSPSETHPYNPSVFTAEGYLVLRPDIVYRPQNPGVSSVECVVPAVEKVVAMGSVDPAKVGIVGHSWGAYQTAFLVTHCDTFAAGVAGAPLTNMMSMSGSVYWNSGMPDGWIFHESQGRMDQPFWRDVETYIENSPIFGIEKMEAPLLIAFGDEDGAVDWNQGVEMYNAARLAQKQLVMLVYEGENHGLSEEPNQVDYHYRVKEWFGHYLKGDPAPEWITDGTSFLDRKKEIEKLKEKKGKK